jgi:hypothetical protein
MSCANTADHSLVVLIVPSRLASRWPAFIATIVAFHDAFREALEMRRTAYKKHRLNDE